MCVYVRDQVTLDCPGNEEAPRVDKLVERIFHCSCQSCSKDGGQEGAVMQLYSADNGLDASSLLDSAGGAQSHPQLHSDIHANKHAHTHTDHHTLPHTSAGGWRGPVVSPLFPPSLTHTNTPSCVPVCCLLLRHFENVTHSRTCARARSHTHTTVMLSDLTQTHTLLYIHSHKHTSSCSFLFSWMNTRNVCVNLCVILIRRTFIILAFYCK